MSIKIHHDSNDTSKYVLTAILICEISENTESLVRSRAFTRLRAPPHIMLINYKGGKRVTLPGRLHFNQVIKANVTGNRMSGDRALGRGME